MKFRMLLLSVIALALLLASCSPPELRDQTLLQDDSLLTNEPCAAPCWRGIVPGETAWSDALTMLEDDPTIENLAVQQSEDSTALYAEWQQVGGSPGCCQIYSSQGRTVDLVFLRVTPTVTLGGVIASKGEPTYALSTPFSDGQSILNVVYPNIPMVLYVFVGGTEASVLESSEIIGVLYTTDGDMEELLQQSSLHIWEGYQSYETYSDASPFEVTPEPVSTEEAEVTPEATEEGA